jgi:DMSO/TMAO reductase YedYZ molybdopterin-dependent catalytic subunit
MTAREQRRAAGVLIDRAVHELERARSFDEAVRRSPLFTRRGFVSVSTSSLVTAFLAACNSDGPDAAKSALAFAERRNEAVGKWLMRHTHMNSAAESARIAGNAFPSYYISRVVPTWDPAAQGEWSVSVEGLVRTPLRFTLPELTQLPSIEQRVDHFCVEGWTAVANFRGVRIRELAQMAGVLAGAQAVDFASFDSGYHESWDMESAMHPQTIVVYAKDGKLLPPAYGAPARLHSPVKLGYKSTKYLVRIEFLARRNGGYWTDRGYEWYAGT